MMAESMYLSMATLLTREENVQKHLKVKLNNSAKRNGERDCNVRFSFKKDALACYHRWYEGYMAPTGYVMDVLQSGVHI